MEDKQTINLEIKKLILEKIVDQIELNKHLGSLINTIKDGNLRITNEDILDAFSTYRGEFGLNELLRTYNKLFDEEEFKEYQRISDERCKLYTNQIIKLIMGK